MNKNEQYYQEYRLNVIHYLPKLKFLDTEPVSLNEREESKKEITEGNVSLNCDSMPSFCTKLQQFTQSDIRHNRSSRHKKAKKEKMIRYELNGGETFRLYSYYKPIKIIGSGAYGVVCSAIDKRNNKKVAIKKCTGIFEEAYDAKNLLREIKLLSYFTKTKYSDIIQIYDCISPETNEIHKFNDIYIVMPFYKSTLLNIIESKQKLTHQHFQYLTYQILRGLKDIHESGVIHRDIKPENILIDTAECKVKIIDFGISRGILETKYVYNSNLIEYPGTRWYGRFHIYNIFILIYYFNVLHIDWYITI